MLVYEGQLRWLDRHLPNAGLLPSLGVGQNVLHLAPEHTWLRRICGENLLIVQRDTASFVAFISTFVEIKEVFVSCNILLPVEGTLVVPEHMGLGFEVMLCGVIILRCLARANCIETPVPRLQGNMHVSCGEHALPF